MTLNEYPFRLFRVVTLTRKTERLESYKSIVNNFVLVNIIEQFHSTNSQRQDTTVRP